MKTHNFSEDSVPYFSWDRNLTVRDIKTQLRDLNGTPRDRLIAWIMREAAFPHVWEFVTPREVSERLPHLEKYLSRKKTFWKYIIGAWHELGKL